MEEALRELRLRKGKAVQFVDLVECRDQDESPLTYVLDAVIILQCLWAILLSIKRMVNWRCYRGKNCCVNSQQVLSIILVSGFCFLEI